MPAKTIQVSTDNITWVTLPGNTAEANSEAGTFDDTVFGQGFESQDTGIINWDVSANGFYKNFPGYKATVKKQGTPTVMTTEAMSLVSGKIYQVTASTKRLIDIDTVTNVFDNAVNQNANVESIDFLAGRVTFKTAYTVTGPVTITGKYIPLADLAGYKSFTLGLSSAAVDTTDIPTARANGGMGVFQAGLKTVELELSGVYNLTNGYQAALIARTQLVIEICPDGTDKSVFRGYFKPGSHNQSGEVGALEEEKVSFMLSVPSVNALMSAPVTIIHDAATTLNLGIRNILAAWLTDAPIYVKYLHNGTAGFSGSTVVTEATLEGGLESMNEFSFSFQGSGSKTTI